MDRSILKMMKDSDPFGLLQIKPKKKTDNNADSTLVANFKKINAFIRDEGHAPRKDSEDIHEQILYEGLNSILKDNAMIQELLPYDEQELFPVSEKEKSLSEIFSDDPFGLLRDKPDSIFNLTHVPIKKHTPDYIAKRKPCADFDQFEPLFLDCHKALSEGTQNLHPFATESEIGQGCFYLLKGMFVYVAEIGPKMTRNGVVNARLRCVFENGTVSNMLLRSLARRLYDGGGKLVTNQDGADNEVHVVPEGSVQAGYVYIARSLSDQPKIKSLKNLYKIGFTSQPVGNRTANAASDPTFLMCEVALVSTFEVYNVDPNAVERLLHRFFGNVCLDIEIIDGFGKTHRPREWFIAPLAVIERAIQLLISGEIVHYRYDVQASEIVDK